MKMPVASHSHSTSDIFSCPGSWEFCWGGHMVCCASSLCTLRVRQLVPENPTQFSGSPDHGAVLGIPALWYALGNREVAGYREGAGGGCPPQGSCAGSVCVIPSQWASHVVFHLCFIKSTQRLCEHRIVLRRGLF